MNTASHRRNRCVIVLCYRWENPFVREEKPIWLTDGKIYCIGQKKETGAIGPQSELIQHLVDFRQLRIGVIESDGHGNSPSRCA